MSKDNRRFQRFSSVYTCNCCKKQTRETGNNESNCNLCAKCYESGAWYNHHTDNHKPNQKPSKDCYCQGSCIFCDNPSIDCEHQLTTGAN